MMSSFLNFFLETKGKGRSELSAAIREWAIHDGYVIDLIFVLALLLINSFVPLKTIPPLKRYVIPNDPSTSYPDVPSTITGEQLAILMLVVPMGTFLVALIFHRRLSDFHHAMLTLGEGFALATLFKRWMNLVGRLRPNAQALFDTLDPAELENARESYPSGHAAYIFLAMTITSLYITGHSKILASPRRGQFPAALACISPLVLAAFVAVSRPADYKHHFSDVNAGMFLGLTLGAFSYALNFESPLDPTRAGQPRFRHVVPDWARRIDAASAAAAAPLDCGGEGGRGQEMSKCGGGGGGGRSGGSSPLTPMLSDAIRAGAEGSRYSDAV